MIFRKKRESRKSSRSSLGRFYVLCVGALCISLLVVNGLLVRSFLTANSRLFIELQAEQAIQYIVPVGMIFVEFWLYDLLLGRH
jgi:hypothetical protein